jgi:pyruvate/2-oxoglutarate dehydrogenase complex dihydrolipoamide dehydrogenase (E3) component
MLDVIVLGGGVAGLTAARRAAELGAKTALLTSQELGGMGASDGPVPVRALAHAARLVREARQLPKYGIAAIEPKVQYTKLLGRVREVVAQVHDALDARAGLQRLGAEVHSHAGVAWFVDPHTVETGSGLRLQGRCFIISVGGRPKPLPVPGGHLAVSHSAAWSLTDIPASIAVIGSGATGAQVASVFSAFGAKVWLLEIAPHILPTEDGEVAKAVASAFRENGVVVLVVLAGRWAVSQRPALPGLERPHFSGRSQPAAPGGRDRGRDGRSRLDTGRARAKRRAARGVPGPRAVTTERRPP